MSDNTIYLITGANRGLGRAMAAAFLARAQVTVVAAVRDPSSTNAQSLHELPTGPSSRLILVKIDSASESDAAAAIAILQNNEKIEHLDIVVANAAIGKTSNNIFDGTCAGINTKEIYEHFTINTIGPLILFKSTLPLLEKSTKTPRFIVMSSFASSIAAMEACPFPNAAYGPSKAAINYLTRKMHFENENLITFALNPGWVQTDMGNAGARMFGMEKAELTIDESINGLLAVIDGATREKTSGKFMQHTGTELQW